MSEQRKTLTAFQKAYIQTQEEMSFAREFAESSETPNISEKNADIDSKIIENGETRSENTCKPDEDALAATKRFCR